MTAGFFVSQRPGGAVPTSAAVLHAKTPPSPAGFFDLEVAGELLGEAPDPDIIMRRVATSERTMTPAMASPR